MGSVGLYRGYIGIMELKIETAVGICRDFKGPGFGS